MQRFLYASMHINTTNSLTNGLCRVIEEPFLKFLLQVLIKQLLQILSLYVLFLKAVEIIISLLSSTLTAQSIG
jgi:hypothetical protein